MTGPPTEPEREVVGWAELERLVESLADQVRGEQDTMLAITRGGLVPAGMLAYRLGIRDILVAAVAYYDEAGGGGRRRPSSSSRPIPSSAAGGSSSSTRSGTAVRRSRR